MSLWGITAFFNPTASPVRVENFKRFARSARAQGLKLLVVELIYDKAELRDTTVADRYVILTSGALLWQKERLLNLGLKYLPAACDKVAWPDGDLLFENDDWVDETAKALDRSPVVQLFESCADGDEGQTGMAACRQLNRDVILGHPGFAWAARRDLLDRHGFYDRSIVGGGDTVMSWASYGVLWPGHNRAAVYFSPGHLADIEHWSSAWHADVLGQVGHVSGTIVHLAHGSKQGRQYMQRTKILKDADFTPSRDIVAGPETPWHWASNKPQLHSQVADYFEQRKEAA